MILKDYHVHTTYCDGKSTAEETVKAAISRGVHTLGFSGHSYTSFDTDYCMTPEKTEKYIDEISFLKEKYGDRINILCGIELDAYSDIDVSRFDYAIGSAHYIKKDGCYIPVDLSADILFCAAAEHFGGDIYALTEAYYETVLLLKDKKIDIIGHFDLITKFNQNSVMFDEQHPRYINAAVKAIDVLIQKNIPFEINTGVIIRGYKDKPYPSDFILDKITEKGGRFLLNSDSHRSDMLCFEFEKWRAHADSRKVNWFE